MNDPTDIRTLVLERDLPFPAEKVWRALTEPHLMAEWLMRNDFAPDVGRAFRFTADWGSVDCRVIEVEPSTSLSYRWDAMGLESTVTWTLTPTPSGTHLRLEQSGFRPEQGQAFHGARFGWTNFLNQLEALLGREA